MGAPGALAFAAVVTAALTLAPGAAGHPARAPTVPTTPPAEVDPIREGDEDLYRSQVSAIKPRVSGLAAEVLGGDEKLQVTWTREPPLVILGFDDEPMIRLGRGGVEINTRSPSVYLASDRYAQVPVPVTADSAAVPRWRRVDTPGPFSFYDHRIHWMDAERPQVVGDGTESVPIYHWKVPALLGARRVTILGALDWAPDPNAIRSRASSVSSPLLSAAILFAALAFGAAVGVLCRRRLEAGAAD